MHSGVPPPRVSVIMPCYYRMERAAYAHAAVASVLQQTFRDFELLVVDDASPERIGALPADPRLRVIRHDRNLGVSGARNTGWRAARADLIAFLDDDDLWLPGYLAHMTGIFAAQPSAGMVLSQVAFLSEATGQLQPKRRDGPAGFNTLKQLIDHGNASPSTTMLRRARMEEIGGFDSELSSCSDLDLILRAAERCPVYVSHEIFCHYRWHASNMSRNDQVMGQEAVRVWEKFLSRHTGESQPAGLSRLWIRKKMARQHHRVARAYATEGRPEDACRHMREAVRLWPSIGRSFDPTPRTPIGRAWKIAKPYVAIAALTLASTAVGRLLRARIRPR